MYFMYFVATSCTPGTTYKKECNTCTCTEHGTEACTLKLCI